MKSKAKRILCLVLSMILIMSLVGCGKDTTPADTKKEEVTETKTDAGTPSEGYKAGTYQATAKGHNGDMTIEVVFSSDAIVSVTILNHVESEGISDAARENIPADVVTGQTLKVDTVTGATVSSNAILKAIEDCVSQAGGDVAALKAKEFVKEKNTDVTEMTTDVVVVGAGGAGLVAAASAQENGAQVIVLEKLAMVGGSTALSGGGIAATGTKFQVAEGIEDSKESWMELWKERQAASNPNGMYPDYEAVDRFMDEAIITTEWLVDYVGHEYSAIAGYGLDPVRRLHFAYSDANIKGGTSLTQNVEKFILGKNVQILTETPATELIVDNDGNVVGVMAEGKEGTIKINAKKVILAAGGFAKSDELLERLVPKAAGSAALSVASAGSTGDGILMAEKLGAALYEEPWVIGLGIGTKVAGTSSLGMDWSKIYVDGNGERFTSEEIHYAISTNKIIEAESPWVIIDSTEANQALVDALEAAMPSEEVVKADTFETLAEAMGVSADNLVKTMEAYNEGAASGNDPMGKSKDYVIAVTSAPYYALKIYPRTMGTFGGVKTDANYNVVREDGTVINNLYAVGENANKRLYNQVYMSGSAVQFAMTSGRLAGAHAAKNMQ